ncbi:MAG TPA: PIN domain-containing protein [Gemmataceae bacterium]|nr:PIN domain-containing protein [Gemmataceae bacterium]
MSRVIVLDSAPLSLLCAPVKKGGEAADCARWLAGLLTAGARVIVPEIADYEVRRELIRAGKASSIARLDALASATEYLPLSTVAMRKAADLWAAVRKAGKPTASEKAIDGDAILAGQAITLGAPDFVVATTNVGHLSRFVAAEEWRSVTT